MSLKRWIVKIHPEMTGLRTEAFQSGDFMTEVFSSYEEIPTDSRPLYEGSDAEHIPEVSFLITQARLVTGTGPEERLPDMDMHICETKTDERSAALPFVIISTEQPAPAAMSSDNHTVYVPVNIGPETDLQEHIPESEINRILRKVYEFPQARILIAIHGSHTDPVHEKHLSNLLKAAGYRHRYLSHRPEQLLYPATVSYLHLGGYVKDQIMFYLKETKQALSKDSVLHAHFLPGG